ncbi:hypothetical protein PVAG01_09878 [Phlyctema vagabunda]|uniref:Uncharacterized protein n=1 Tax=Phlyctema vagabunda TaxID=108571 RepID=A0ABR4P4F1_9HELO
MRYSFITLAAIIASVCASPQAAAGTIGLGAACNDKSECANGADCYGVTSFTRKTCGSFQSSCTSDEQCATNTCQNGLCGGFLASSLFRITSTASATGAAAPTGTGSTPTTSVTASGVTPTASSSSTLAPFTGAAAREKVGGGVAMAAVLVAAMI